MKLNKTLSLFTLAAVSIAAVGCGPSTNQMDLSNSLDTDVSSLSATSGIHSGDVVPGEFIIKYKSTATNSIGILSNVGATKVRDLHSAGTQLIRISGAASNGTDVLKTLRSNPSVQWVEANRFITVPKFFTDILNTITGRVDSFPNDPKFGDQYAHKVSDSAKGWELAKANSKKPSTIAIIDTGIDGTHPDLKAKLIVPGYDAYGKGQEYVDKQGHGSHCAGIASAITNNGIGVAGYSPDSRLIAVKVLQDNGSGTYAAVADGIAWAAKNPEIDVLSMSLGGPSSSQAIEDAVNIALQNNKIVVAAMGNDGNDSLSYPAAIKGVTAVGATDANDKIASFSQYGKHISVSAPGVNILSTFPMYQSGMPAKEYGKISGTSMACPAVSGLAGLLKTVNPSLKGSEIRKIIEETADDLGDKGFDIHYGFGRINTFKAVSKVVGSRR